TFAIITTESNPLTSYIHNTNFRMPVILSKGDEERWLAPDLSKDEITSLLKPYCANLMKVNFVSHDRLIERNPNCPVTTI
ncbi:MAG: SOS response-associated peptidase family protein, partial [Bacteroides xylanisolvens]